MKQFMRIASMLSGVIILSLSISAKADPNWILLRSKKDGSRTVYIDKSSIRITGSIRRYWERVDLVRDKEGWEKTLILYESNCETD